MAQVPSLSFPIPYELTPIPPSFLRYALIAVAVLISYGIVGSHYIMGLDPVDSVYFTITTITTVGFGDIVPITATQKIFTITLVLGGVGLLAYTFLLVITVSIMTVEELRTGVRERRRIAAIKNHFILCGYGRVGSAVHDYLLNRDKNTVIIELDKNSIEKELWEDPDVLAIQGDATDEDIMKVAGIERARGVIITTGNDVDNLFITLTAREINSDIWIVTRASKKVNVKRLYRSGADKVISPEVSGAEDIYFAAIQPTTMKITEMHGVNDIRKEAEIIFKHNCTLEDIEYHLPEFKEPLIRKIEISHNDQIDKFLDSLKKDSSREKSLKRIYESVSGIHSHWISGPSKDALNAVASELKEEGLLLGVDLNEEEIRDVARKYGRVVEVVVKPEIKITETHDVRDIREETEIILKHGGILEDIEYYLPGFNEPLYKKIGLSEKEDMKRFLTHLKNDNNRMKSIERLYTLSGGGVHSHRVSAPNTDDLIKIEQELRNKGFLLGVNLEHDEINKKIQEYGRVSEMFLRHNTGEIDDKKLIIHNSGSILDSKYYIPGVRQVFTRPLYLKNEDDIKSCEREYKKPEAQRSLKAISVLSKNIHSHTVSARNFESIKKIEKVLDKSGMLIGVNLTEDEIWEIIENTTAETISID